MKLCDDRTYFIFPAYGTQFREMQPWMAYWQETSDEVLRFWHGFSGGGILAIPNSMSPRDQYELATADYQCRTKAVYGMALGNEAGQQLAAAVSCAEEDRPPASAVRMGAARVPNPTVKMTPEHAALSEDERLLLIVPRLKRKSLRLIEKLPEWFSQFGVDIEETPSDIEALLGNELQDWFTEPARTMFGYRMTGGIDHAAWQTAVVYYVAEYWDTQARGLDSIHFVANIAGEPCFRRNWTSNK